MGQTIELTAADGHRIGAWQADPDGRPRGGLVVIQEIFGVNAHIRSVAESFAADGWTAVAPALFDRVRRDIQLDYGPEDIEAGREVMAKIPLDTALMDVGAAIAALKAMGVKVGVVGYCWGGTLAWAAACRLDGLDAAVSYYGGGVPGMADERPSCPVQLHFGEQDHAIPMEGVERFRQSHPDLPLFTYPAGHGFSCDARGSYHAESARQARERTDRFLDEHLAGG